MTTKNVIREWFPDPSDAWFTLQSTHGQTPRPNLTEYEKEAPAVIYDHTGQPFVREKPHFGFIKPTK